MASSAPKSPGQWPPRSPHEALMSTPGGRQKFRRMLDQTSPSPTSSPSRAAGASRALSKITGNLPPGADEDDEEDEETLQLQLQEIQARLKLKKLQKSQQLSNAPSSQPSRPEEGDGATAEHVQLRNKRASTPTRDNQQPASSFPSIQVPVSPAKHLQEPQEQTSPRRVQLGIDKGLTAKDISLRRAPSSKPSGWLRTSRSSSHVAERGGASATHRAGSSFNDRLAQARNDEVAQAEKRQRVLQARSSAFGLSRAEMEKYKESETEIPQQVIAAPSFSRQEVVSHKRYSPLPEGQLLKGDLDEDVFTEKMPAPGEILEKHAKSFEPYSSFHLKTRILPHKEIARQVQGKKVYTIPALMQKVTSSNNFRLPDDELDIIVFAIVAKKSDVKYPKNGDSDLSGGATSARKRASSGPFMILTLVDLTLTLDMFLFHTGFERFWKLKEGTVVAILNPNIMPPRPSRDDGKFCLAVNSDTDTILEIGTARDLGFCKAKKKDSTSCGSWVNSKRTKYCTYHSQNALNKKRSGRMEFSGAGYGTRSEGLDEAAKHLKFQESRKRQYETNEHYDRDTQSHWFALSRSTADLIDGNSDSVVDQKDKKEYLKRKMAAQERENEMIAKLGRVGDGAGREYMQRAGARLAASASLAGSSQMYSASNDHGMEEPPDAAALGLTSQGHKVHLSPAKRKRPASSRAGSATSVSRTPAAYGWGSNLKDKLSKMKEAEKRPKEATDTLQPPQRKKTRFVTAKGIREAGRESLGADLSEQRAAAVVNLGEDDDDELVILG